MSHSSQEANRDPFAHLLPIGIQAVPPIDRIADLLDAWLDHHEARLPMLPEVANQVIQLVENELSNQQRIADLIQADQALAGWIMRAANSAAYYSGGTIVTLQQAIARLGIVQIGDIAMCATLQLEIFRSGHRHQPLMQQLSREALCQGLWAKEIARHIRQNVESAFLCGLLQSIGRPLVLLAISDIEENTGSHLLDNDVLVLLERFGLTYGLQLARHWQLPAPSTACIEFADNHRKAGAHSNIACIANAARQFSWYHLNPAQHTEIALRTHPTLSSLNLYMEDIDTLLGRRDTITQKLSALQGRS